MAAFIGFTTFSKDARTDTEWRTFIGGYAQISAVCEDAQGAQLIPTLRADDVWFVSQLKVHSFLLEQILRLLIVNIYS